MSVPTIDEWLRDHPEDAGDGAGDCPPRPSPAPRRTRVHQRALPYIPTVDEAARLGLLDDEDAPARPTRPLDAVGQVDVTPELRAAYALAGRPLPTAEQLTAERQAAERRRLQRAAEQDAARADVQAAGAAAWHQAHSSTPAQVSTPWRSA